MFMADLSSAEGARASAAGAKPVAGGLGGLAPPPRKFGNNGAIWCILVHFGEQTEALKRNQTLSFWPNKI